MNNVRANPYFADNPFFYWELYYTGLFAVFLTPVHTSWPKLEPTPIIFICMPMNISAIDLETIDVVILSGGQGTRLKKVVSDRPKPMAVINQRPFLDILIDYVSSYGFKRFILCTGHMSDVIRNYYTDKVGPQKILFSNEEAPLGTGGAIKKAENLIKSSSFLVMNGDSFCPADLSLFYNFHLKKESLTSIVVLNSKESQDYGSIVLSDSQKVIRFEEKRKESTGFISAGIYLFRQEILSLIPSYIKYSLERELFPKLVGQEFYGYITEKRLIDIGTPERLEKARALLSGSHHC